MMMTTNKTRSSLPDEILQQILSLLDTKYAAFCRKDGDKSITDMLSFRLLYHEEQCLEAESVCSWICNSVKHKVEELNIDVFMVRLIDELPKCLFNCESLKLLRFKFSFHFTLPSCSIYLPALKAIHLSSITFKDDNLSKLLVNCPILEALVLVEIEFDMLEKLTIFAPQLKHLTIHKCNDGDYSDPIVCKIEIFAPNLISFWCNDHMAREFSVETFSSPVIAEFDMRIEAIYIFESEKGVELPEEKNEEYALHAIKYLRHKNSNIIALVD
ncbi:F-box domain [Thalictrum thalictroides]|uniref:F-box domain n=1 Tax=Thalictrum thalictroides TaxID=46969 RepID=A0A7J6VBZ0_THATH|nr:F-box domain [Thalictrum thalictroides]